MKNMKNIKILSAILFGFALFGCDPLEDELKQVNDEFAFVQDIEITLTDDDYDVANEACDCSPFGNFSSEDDAKAGIAAVLNKNYPGLGKGSSAIVTYDIYNGSSPDLRGTYSTATVSSQEYQDLGFTFGNFNNVDANVAEYANYKYPNAEDGDYADITFDYYDGSFHGGEVSRVVYTVAYGWQYTLILPDAVYGEFFGESGTDFSYEDEGAEKMAVYLNYLLSTAGDFNSLNISAGKIVVVQYNFDDRFTDPDNPGLPNVPVVSMFLFNGTGWVSYSDGYQITQNTLSFGHDGSAWVPDNTIKYSLNNDDYQAIGAATETSNPAGSISAATYGNFDLGLWSSDQIFEVITNRLLNINGILKEDGQKYLVSYATWEPGAGSGLIHVIYDSGAGAFVLVE
jgi:hypothetical protein